MLFSIIKFLGAGYLIYIGYKSLRARANKIKLDDFEKERELSKFSAIKMGFLTNVLNPKASLFFLSLFTQIINPSTPVFIQVLYGLEMSLMTFFWFSFVATILSHNLIKKSFSNIQHYVERAFGVILVALGIKVALTRFK